MGWNDRTTTDLTGRQLKMKTRGIRTAELPVESHTLPLKSNRQRMHVFTPDGVNHGGHCQGCGGQLGFWYHIQRCDRCMEFHRSAIITSYADRRH